MLKVFSKKQKEREFNRNDDILTNERNDSFHMAFVDMFWFAWNFARVKPNPTKGKMQMSRDSSTDSDQMDQTTGRLMKTL